MKTKSLFLSAALMAVMLLPLWQSSKVMAEWKPNLKYAKWVETFAVDKIWQFDDAESGGHGNRETGTHLVDHPGTIAWSFMSYDECTTSTNDYNMNWLKCFVSNTDHTYLKMALIQIYKNDDEDIKPISISDYNGCRSWCVQVRHYSNDGGCEMVYMVTQYSSAVRKWIEKYGDQFCVNVSLEWDKDHNGKWTKFDEYSDPVDKADRTFLTVSAPQVSEPSWMEKDGKTYIQYNRKIQEKCKLHIVKSYSGGSKDYGWTDVNATSGDEHCLLYPFDDVSSTVILKPTVDQTLKYTFQTSKSYPYSDRFYTLHGCPNDYPGASSVYSSKVTLTPPNFYQPYNITAVDKGNGTVELTWNIRNTTGDKSRFVIERSFDKDYKK